MNNSETNFIYKHIFKCERLNDDKLPYGIKESKINNERDAERIARDIYNKENIDLIIREVCFAIFLNRANEVVGYYKISEGGISDTSIDIKMTTKSALDTFANGVILVHNHPSNNPYPSAADLKITEKLRNALNFFDISLLDHIIITDDDNAYYFSTETTKKH